MTRIMGDATHANVIALAAVPGLELVAGYATGTQDIQWTTADRAMFAGKALVTIDQGGVGSPVMTSMVRDVEPGAWTPASAVNRNGWTATRPTIYCDRTDLPAVLSLGWQGDLWLAIPGWQPGGALPAAPGCTIAAVQNQQNVGGTIDLSVVLDDTWPEGDPMGTGSIIVWGPVNAYLLNGGRAHHIDGNSELSIYAALGVPGAAVPTTRLSATEETQFLADFPPGNPAVTVTVTPG